MNRDPDRRRHPGYWPLDPDLDLDVCGICACLVPATDKAHQIHRAMHPQPSEAGRGADEAPASPQQPPASDPTSGTGSSADGGTQGVVPSSPVPGPTSGGGERVTQPSTRPGSDRHDPPPGPKRPPSPVEKAKAGPAGDEGANQSSVPLASSPPEARGTRRGGRYQRPSGKGAAVPAATQRAGRGHGPSPAGPPTDPEQAALDAWEDAHADERNYGGSTR